MTTPSTVNQVGPSRLTARAVDIRDALANQSSFLSAQDLYSVIRAAGSRIGLSTVYRHLQTFADEGVVDVIRLAEGETLYRYCGDASPKAHHHHLICRSCGRAEEVEGLAVERWANRVANEHGFVEVDHTVEVFGLCRQCAQ